MPAPVAISDALESVLDIFFSGVRNRERAAFILCDNLVEMACKTRAKQHEASFNTRANFPSLLSAPGVALDAQGLGRRVQDHHDARNNMQHANAAATVDAAYCAVAIADAAEVIQTLWPDVTWPGRVRCGLRIVRLYALMDDPLACESFENSMNDFGWRAATNETVRVNAVQVQPGRREHWWWALRYRLPNVEALLNEIGAPD